MLNDYFANIVVQIMFLMMLGVSLNLLMGYAGQMSMAHASFYGLGAYSAGILSMPVAEAAAASVSVAGRNGGYGWALSWAAGAGVLIAFVCAAVISLPAVSRVRGDFMILATLAFQLVVNQLMDSLTSFTGGTYGLSPIPPLSLFGTTLSSPSQAMWFILPVTVAVVLFAWRLGESPFGRLLKGIRENEAAVKAAGKDTVGPKLLIFSVAAGLAGLAGTLTAYYYQFIAPSIFNVDFSIQIIAVVILGGLASLAGTLLAAVVLGSLHPVLQQFGGDSAIHWQPVFYGIALMALMRFRPQGLIPERVHSGRRLELEPDRPTMDRAVRETEFADGRTGPAVLQVSGLSKRFGGLKAVDDVSFDLPRGQITALIGPNGAGKTTIFNMLTSFLKADAGSVRLNGQDITGATPHKIAQMGMARSFQDGRLFMKLSAQQNVALAIPGQAGESFLSLFTRPRSVKASEERVRRRALELLEFVGFKASAYSSVENLSYGDQKLVAIARLLATEADVLLLDEPTSGVDPQSADHVIEVIKNLKSLGKTICIVEHSVHLVSRLADHGIFLNQGTVLAEGTVESLINNDKLAEIYFGV